MSRASLVPLAALLLTLPLAAGCNKAEPKQPSAGEAGAPPRPELVDEPDAPELEPKFEVPYVAYTLDNGLDVILHEDHSDPVVALATIVHVGSNREQPGRTGFAHFFEHMSFNDSENVPRGANRKMIGELGGTRNGGTSSDATTYYEVVPVDAFEKLLWIDSDRLGYMINTVTEWALENEKQVVKNEKRQRVDNVAYGHTRVVIPELLYPPDHPYHWPVIGSLEDLQAATLDDVRGFYDQYYGAANATLVIAGDIDIEQTKALVETWFGEIRRGPEVAPLEPQPASLDADQSVVHVDNFAKVPELTWTFPTVERFDEDSYALEALAELLSTGKRAPLYQVIVEDQKLAPSVAAWHDAREIAGTFQIRVRANEGVDLDEVAAAIETSLARFEQQGVRPEDLAQVKAKRETRFYERASDVLGKAFMLGNYNEFAGDPGYYATELAAIQSLTLDDLRRVYETYVAGKAKVVTSFVPRGDEALAVEGASVARVSEEKIVPGAEQAIAADPEFAYAKTETKHDRSEPALTELPPTTLPEVWASDTDNGLRLLGIEHDELPLVAITLRIEGGHSLDPAGKDGAMALLAKQLLEGTKSKTPEQLQDAFGMLGARVSAYASDEALVIEASGLARHYDALAALLTEIVLEPRWDEVEFTRLAAAQVESIRQRAGRPTAIAQDVFERVVYGPDHSFAVPASGTLDSVAAIALEDLKTLWAETVAPTHASVMVAGDVDQARAERAFTRLEDEWKPRAVSLPSEPLPPPPSEPKLYFVDVPGSKQSVLVVGRLALAGNDPAYNQLSYANDALGSGSKSRLFQLLRIEKGYTYGARSRVPRTRAVSPWSASTSVRANVTLESLELIREQITTYAATYTADDLALSTSLIAKQNARRFEDLPALMGVLGRIAGLDLPTDYLAREQAQLEAASLGRAHELIRTYLDPSQMVYVVVGDGATQLERVAQFGLGDPILLGVDGEPLAAPPEPAKP